MGETLVIVESPSKAKTIKKYLPRGYQVEATMGHVIDLPKSRMGIDIENDFEPEYIKIRGKGDLLKAIKKAAKKADKVLLATDPDREGEAISWHTANFLDIDPESPCRIEFHEITKNAIREAIKNKRPVDMNLVNAQQGRRVLDRLVGYSISPVLWAKVHRGLSAGRVQSVATRMIVDREAEIEDFVPEEYWELTAHLKKQGERKSFTAKLHSEKGSKLKITNGEEAARLEKAALENPYIVSEIKKRTRKSKPPLPFTTSTLQQAAYQSLGFTTAKTMRVVQQLYEGLRIAGRGQIGLVTYIRTDSTRLADEAVTAARKWIAGELGEDYIGSGSKSVKKKGVQDAHEAIRPVDVTLTPEMTETSLEKDQYRLYKLIWERMMASQMAEAVYHVTDIDIRCGDLIFKTQGESLAFKGYTAVLTTKQKKDVYLPELEKGELLKFSKLDKEQKFTLPPSRYTEASLVKAMEEKGIGRPSTYAPTIATIKARNYVEVKNKQFYPTDLGIIVTEFMKTYFEEEVDETFTAKMENDLDEVAVGEKDWKQVIGSFYDHFGKELKKAREEAEKIEIQDQTTEEICPNCGKNMVIKNGPFGKFLACPAYPECKTTKPILHKTGGICPVCGGDLVELKSKRGKLFYGCSGYPACDFSSWDRPVAEKCPDCGQTMFQKGFGKKAKLYCMQCSKENN